MSVLTDSCSPEVNEKVCKICEDRYETMGSIICPETDTRMLEKIYASTNVRVQPRKGIITPVCEYCRERIDDYDDNFKPYVKEYLVDASEEEYESVDPLGDASIGGLESSGDDALLLRVNDRDCVSDLEEVGQDNHLKREQGTTESNCGKLAVLRKPSECPVCRKQVKFLSDHIKIHSATKRYKCTLCAKSFTQSSNLTHHMKTHTGEKPFECDKCAKQFISRAHLQSHMKQHNDEKLYQCEACSKRFNHVGNLNKHQRVHSGEKPYGCEYCEKRFSNISNKKLHEERHRGERSMVCEVCSKAFHDMYHLERHKLVHRKRGKCEN